jgi:hypothetical protein
MKTQPHPATLLIISGVLSACTSVKRDDHSYTYIYQHNPAPQRQVVETVTTHQTRASRFTVTAPEDGPVSSLEPDSARNDDGAEPDLRADPIAPSDRRPAYLGRGLDVAPEFYRMPVRMVIAPYRMPPPVSYYRPTVFPD